MGEIEGYIRRLAAANKIKAVQTDADRLAYTFARLADAASPVDEVELLLLRLRRKGVIDKFQRADLQSKYLAERRDADIAV